MCTAARSAPPPCSDGSTKHTFLRAIRHATDRAGCAQASRSAGAETSCIIRAACASSVCARAVS